MSDPVDVGPVFVYTVRLKKNAPLLERSWTREIDGDLRVGTCVILRVPLTGLGLVVGRWQARYVDEDQALDAALRGSDEAAPSRFSVEEIRAWG